MTKTIMIVDDEPNTVELVKLVLETGGYETSAAFSGLEALEKINTKKPDMILLDIMMPGMDGWEVRKKLLEEKETKKIPIVMLTAKSHPIDKIKGLYVVRTDDYITKPFGCSELVNKVRKILGE